MTIENRRGGEKCEFGAMRSGWIVRTIRREHLDRMFFWNAVDLARKLGEFKTYYNSNRCHQSLRGGTRLEKPGKPAARRASLSRYD